MQANLALKLLDKVAGWDREELGVYVRDLGRLAAYKYDDYEGFSAGGRFLESFARWLSQFEDRDEQKRLADFVRSELVFISRDELNHAIACAYPDYIKPALMKRVADEQALDEFAVDAVAAHPEFRALRRQTLFLGLSDGARLDRLRRSSPELSHEQFWLSPELGDTGRASMSKKLAEALSSLALPGDARFRQVVLVDDFYGSGTSLIDVDEHDEFRGKLKRVADSLAKLGGPAEHEGFPLEPVLAEDATVSVVLYVASARAEDHIREMLEKFRPHGQLWQLAVVQRLPAELVMHDQLLVSICERFYDPVLVDEHKDFAPLGYKDTALPVVLHHNTPNNSISVLWADTTDRDDGLKRRALFPRYERHHVDRP